MAAALLLLVRFNPTRSAAPSRFLPHLPLCCVTTRKCRAWDVSVAARPDLTATPKAQLERITAGRMRAAAEVRRRNQQAGSSHEAEHAPPTAGSRFAYRQLARAQASQLPRTSGGDRRPPQTSGARSTESSRTVHPEHDPSASVKLAPATTAASAEQQEAGRLMLTASCCSHRR